MQKTPDVAPYLRPQMLSPLQPSVAQTKSSVVHEIVGASFFVFFVFLFVGVGRGEEGGGEERRSDAISADVLKIRSQTRDPTWPLRLKR